MVFQQQIDNEAILDLPLIAFEGEIHLISHPSEVKKAIRRLEQMPVLGFDTETKPSFKKGKSNPVSLIQLAAENEAWLFRVNLLGRLPAINQILGNASLLKIGLALKEDLRSLSDCCTPNPDSFLDLQDFAPHFGIQEGGLKKMAAIVLGARISKSQQLSNWDRPDLSEAQLRYAATDAWIALKIYQQLTAKS